MPLLNFTKPLIQNSKGPPKTTQQLLEESELLLKSISSSSPKPSPTVSGSKSRIINGNRPEELDFYWATFHNPSVPFLDHIKDREDQILAVYNYYVRPSERYETVWTLVNPTVNSICIVHNHPFNQVCEGGWAVNGCKIKPPNNK